jgi:hypothetical protein
MTDWRDLKVGDIIDYDFGIDRDILLILAINQDIINTMNLYDGRIDILKTIWIGPDSTKIIG